MQSVDLVRLKRGHINHDTIRHNVLYLEATVNHNIVTTTQ